MRKCGFALLYMNSAYSAIFNAASKYASKYKRDENT